jgi:hypothetical protein
LPLNQPKPLPLQHRPHLHQQRQKLSLQKVNLLRKTHQKQIPRPQLQPLSKLDDNDDYVVNDEVTFGRNRKAGEFGKLVHEDIELSDHVKFRLWLARQLALKKYQETWG